MCVVDAAAHGWIGMVDEIMVEWGTLILIIGSESCLPCCIFMSVASGVLLRTVLALVQ